MNFSVKPFRVLLCSSTIAIFASHMTSNFQTKSVTATQVFSVYRFSQIVINTHLLLPVLENWGSERNA